MFDFIKNALFPAMCVGCGLEGIIFCETCQKKLRVNKLFVCAYCQRTTTGETCDDCLSVARLDGLWAITDYSEGMRSLVHAYKYAYVMEIEKVFKSLVDTFWIQNKFLDNILTRSGLYVVPIPLHIIKKRKRGFNQSEFIASMIGGKVSGNKILINSIKRNVNISSQTLLQKEARQENVHHIFSVLDNNLIGKNVLLIDDVYTTGSTMGECCKILKEFGVKQVFAITLAK